MLATQVAAEINQRWEEFENLSEFDRLRKLESLVERHLLATGPSCSETYFQTSSDFPDFAARESNAKLEQSTAKLERR